MEMTKRQKNIIATVINNIDLDVSINNEKAIAILTDYINSLYDTTEPNLYEYENNYMHYTLVIHVVFDYLIAQKNKISELNNLLSEYLEISRNKLNLMQQTPNKPQNRIM